MKVEQTSPRDELNLREVTRLLNIDYKKLEKEGQIKQLLNNGVTKALPVSIKVDLAEKKDVSISTTARLVLGSDGEGKRTVNAVFKNENPKLDRYRDIELSAEQQKELRQGKTLVITDGSQREHLVKLDTELNRVAGMKKSIFLVPEKLGSPREGYTKLSNTQQASLKRGEAVELEVGGKKVTAQVDPIERRLKMEQSPKESLDLKLAGPRKKTGPSL